MRVALSRQINRVKKLIGSPSSIAAVSTIPQSVANALSVAGAASSAKVGAVKQVTNAAAENGPDLRGRPRADSADRRSSQVRNPAPTGREQLAGALRERGLAASGHAPAEQ